MNKAFAEMKKKSVAKKSSVNVHCGAFYLLNKKFESHSDINDRLNIR